MKTWWQRFTLRTRLGVWYAGVGTFLLVAYSAIIYVYVSEQIAAQPIGSALQEEMNLVREHLGQADDGSFLWDGDPIAVDGDFSWEDPWFEIWDSEEHALLRHWPYNDSRVKVLPPAPIELNDSIVVYTIAPNTRLRSLVQPLDYSVAPASSLWLRVMRQPESTAQALNALLLIISASLPVLILLLVAGGYLMTHRWLRPLEEMALEADRITAEELGRRLPVSNENDELGRLGTAFNVTLQRLEDSFATLERFVGDASHELRTPLTTLRSVGEVGLRRNRTPEEYRETIGSMLEEAQRLQDLTDRLLELAQAEGGTQGMAPETIDLQSQISDWVADLSVLAEAKRLQVGTNLHTGTLRTDPVLLRQVVQNLLDNAIKYSPENSIIRVSAEPADNGWYITVTDQGPGIKEEDQSRLTDRFFRSQESRDQSTPGHGLGLALTQAYLRVLGGHLEYEPLLPTGSRFRIFVPDTGNADASKS